MRSVEFWSVIGIEKREFRTGNFLQFIACDGGIIALIEAEDGVILTKDISAFRFINEEVIFKNCSIAEYLSFRASGKPGWITDYEKMVVERFEQREGAENYPFLVGHYQMLLETVLG